jgi:putative DNA primase/helicase
MTNLLAEARALAAAGLVVIPCDRTTKAPVVKWKEYQTRFPTDEELQQWFDSDRHGIGVLCGAISGGLEMTEIEGRVADQLSSLAMLAQDSGLGPLWAKVCTGWWEQSPSGGYHWFYYRATVPGNHPIARRRATPEELIEAPGGKVKVLAETRGEGGFVVVAPSVNAAGLPWARMAGGPATAPFLTEEEVDDFHTLLGTLGEEDAQAPAVPSAGVFTRPAGERMPDANGIFEGTRPGDDYNEQTTWEELLLPAGWRQAFQFADGGWAWTRPGKSFGISASTGRNGGDNLFVFTTSTELPDNKPIDKFGYYALTQHDGRISDAASELKRLGYGSDPTVSTGQAPQQVRQQDGNVVRLVDYQPEAVPAADDKPKKKPAVAAPLLTDDGNALLLIARYEGQLLFDTDHERWLVWNGTVWATQGKNGGAANELAKTIGREMEPKGDKAVKHQMHSLNANGISAMLRCASTDPRITIGHDQLDTKGWELNTPGGIVDLRTGQLRPSDPASLHTKITRFVPAQSWEGTRFERFLQTTFPDETIRAYVQRVMGYSIIGQVEQEIMPFAYGGGSNGKTALFEMILGVLGDYGKTSPNGFLMSKQQEQHPTEIARLAGVRFVVCAEVNEKDKFDEAKVKMLCGGDKLSARFMGKDFFDFEPTHQLWLAGNHQPEVASGGAAFWRRLRLIPFTHTVPEEEREPGLPARVVREEGPAVLAWLVQGAQAYAEGGLQEPDGVRAATAEYADSEDHIGRFLQDCCNVGPAANNMPGAHPSVKQVRDRYEAWCRANTEEPLGTRAFPNRLKAVGVKTSANAVKGTGGIRRYSDLALVPDVDEAEVSIFADPRVKD